MNTHIETPVAPTAARDPTEHDVVSAVSQRIILHPVLDTGIKMVLDLVECNKDLSEPRHMIVVGDSGCGKSTLCDELREKLGTTNKDHWFGTQTEISAIFCGVPSPVTPRSMAATLLRAMGVTRHLFGTTYELTEELIMLLKSCQTKLVCLDDFQHLLSKGRTLNQAKSRQLQEVQDWIKSIIVRSGVTFVLLGLHETLALIDCEPQMLRRFTHVYELKPFSRTEIAKAASHSHSGMVVFADDLMYHALTGANYFEDGVDFRGDMDAAMRLYVATNGVPSPVKELIVDATRDAYRRGERIISLANFARAYEKPLQGIRARNERLRRDGAPKEKLIPEVNPFKVPIADIRVMYYKEAA